MTEANAVTPFDYHAVAADLSLPTWVETLIASGFDPSIPTMWLLEGFINYLSEEESTAFMTVLTNTLSAEGSRMMATVCTTSKLGNALHRYFPPDAKVWLESHGWTGECMDINDLGIQFGRPLPGDIFSGYVFAVVGN
eukprot:gene32693-40350_t